MLYNILLDIYKYNGITLTVKPKCENQDSRYFSFSMNMLGQIYT